MSIKTALPRARHVLGSATDLYASLSNEQTASLLAAFPSDNACSVKLKIKPAGQASSLAIKLEQPSRSRPAP